MLRLALLGLVILGSGCAEILGIEPWEERYPDGAAGAGAAAGAGGAGAAAGAAGSGGGVAGTGGSGGAGGAAGGSVPQQHVWSHRFGDDLYDQATSVIADSSGHMIFTGAFTGAIDFNDGQSWQSTGATADTFLTKLDAAGNTVWSKGFAGAGTDDSRCVAVGNQDRVFVAGSFQGSIDLGGGALETNGEENVFLAKFDSDGQHLWSKKFGDTAQQTAFDLAPSPTSGNVAMAGRMAGTMTMGSEVLVSAGAVDVFVAMMTGSGQVEWAKRFGSSQEQIAVKAAVASDESVFVCGPFRNNLAFGTTQLQAEGDYDIYLAKLQPGGEPDWALEFGSPEAEEPHGMALDPSSGNVAICGYFHSPVDFGGGALESAGGADVFVAMFDDAGSHLWSKRFGDEADTQVCHALAVGTDGGVYLAGRARGTIDFGGEPLTCDGDQSLFLAKLAADGEHLFSDCYGESGLQIPHGIALTAADEILIAGGLDGTVDFGGGPLATAGGIDVFVAKFGYPNAP